MSLKNVSHLCRCCGGPVCYIVPFGFPGGEVLYIFWVQGHAIEKGIDFHDFGIRNGIDFHDFGIRNGITFRDFHNRRLRKRWRTSFHAMHDRNMPPSNP